MNETVFTSKIEHLEKEYNTNIDTGLSDAQIAINRDKYGPNKLTSKKEKSWFVIFLEQYKDILMILLLCSALISVIVEIFPKNEAGVKYGWGESLLHIQAWENFILIIGVSLINSILGTVQILKSRKSLNSLKSLSQPKSKVIRNGHSIIIETSDLVVGDVIILEAGDLVPADARLFEAASLKINESSLTGESETILKNCLLLDDPKLGIGDRLNMVFSGCLVTYGRGRAIVTSVGQNTEIGKINRLLNETVEQKTPLQNNLDKLAKALMYVVLVICGVLLAVNLSKLAFLDTIDASNALPVFSDALNFSIALAVAIIPEALSSIVTIVLSISTKKMAKQNAIVKNLKSVEGLGSVSVVCSDKTGTLTQNKMTITNFYVDEKIFDKREFDKNQSSHYQLVKYATLCCDAQVEGDKSVGDPTEIAIVDYFIRNISAQNILNRENKRISELPFDSERMMMSVLIPEKNENLMVTKGAVDNLLDRVTKIYENGQVRDITIKDKSKILEANKTFSSEGKRVLCVAYKEVQSLKLNFEDEEKLIFIGLLAMIDPPRPEVIEAIKECHSAGIKVVMITGDHEGTAVAIGKQIGIFGNDDWSMSGRQLTETSENELASNVMKYSVYARVSPEDKIKIVRAWQSHNMIVSMTGDGVNDAPALKQADIGVAMGITGTEVSKDAASMILTDDNFATIVSAIKSGRNVYNNIKSAIKFLLTGNIATAFIAIILTIISLSFHILVTPFTAIQLLFLNLLVDTFPAIALGLEKYRDNVMLEKPRKANEFFLNRKFSLKMLFESLLMTIIVLASFAIAFSFTNPVEMIGGFDNLLSNDDIISIKFQNASIIAMMTLCFCRYLNGFNCKSERPLVFKKEFYDNNYFFLSLLVGIILMCIIYYAEPVYNVMFRSSSDIFITSGDKTYNLSAKPFELQVFKDYGLWICFAFGFSIIPVIQIYKVCWDKIYLSKLHY